MVKNLGDSVQNTGVPRIQIVDLLVLTTSFAVGLALQEAQVNLGLGNLMQTDYRWFNGASRTVFAAISGLPIAALYCFAIDRRFSEKTLTQPGHWLLLSMLCMTIATAFHVLSAMVPHGFLFFQLDVNQVDLALSAFFSLGSACILFWAGKQNSASWRKVLFLCAFSRTLWPASCTVLVLFGTDGVASGKLLYVLNVIDWVEASLNLIIAVFLTVLAIVEFKNRVRRDLWHWLGVLVALLIVTAAPMIGYIYSRFGLWIIE